MRPLWKGAISFGLVSIPVKMYAATEQKNVKFNYLHRECKTPIKYQKVCPACGKEVSADEIVRGYEYQKGRYVVIEDEDMENLPLNTMRTIDILDFVELEDIDPIYFVKSYFLSPEEYGKKPYKLLFEALGKTGKIAVAKVFIRSRENLVTLRRYRNCLLMETMLYPDEIRQPESIPELLEEVEIHENELTMAESLITNLSSEFKPEKYKSDYREALLKVIHAKIENDEVATPKAPHEEKVIDLMEALKASLAATEGKKEETKKRKRKTAKQKEA
ncbi:MAG TPA: Ku protein [Clostridia bacterium]|jgi:DNA end-binding protein Ku|nr:Ku protein [Clostridia bacterium]